MVKFSQYYGTTNHPKQVLWKTIQSGWLESMSDVLVNIHMYYKCLHELTLQDQFLLKEQCIVILAMKHKEMMGVAKAMHIGNKGCIRRAQSIMYCHQMSTELKEYILLIGQALEMRPMLQHKLVATTTTSLNLKF